MSKQKFKNPMVSAHYKKPACHSDYCFERRACCNNYRCCVCHCCLKDYSFYSKSRDQCVANLTTSYTSLTTTAKVTATKLATTIARKSKELKVTGNQASTSVLVKTSYKGNRGSRGAGSPTSIPQGKEIHTTEIKTTWLPWKATQKKLNSKGANRGYSYSNPDDKTSTIAGVAVALGLVAIVAVIILVVVCSRKNKRKRNEAVKAKASKNDATVVTVPLTIENVSDSSRDPEEGTTSDTTIDSPINGPPLPDGTSSSRPSLNGNLLVPGHATNGHKRVGKKHKKGRKNKENGRAEQKPLFNGGASSCNGNNKKNEMSRASGMESQCCPNNRNGSAGHHLEHVEEHSLNSQVESQVMSKLARSDSLTESEVQNVTSS